MFDHKIYETYKELFKMIVDRHKIRKDYDNKKYLDI